VHCTRLFGVSTACAILLFGTLALSPAAQASLPKTGREAAVIATHQLGIPYLFGGADRNGFDESGLTMYVFSMLGLTLPHGATDQAKLGHRVLFGHLRRGDLVFWGSRAFRRHVAIYVGRGRVISAVKDLSVRYGTLKGAASARRLLPAR
jgi:cell wall-associated NlpC family hydrolase